MAINDITLGDDQPLSNDLKPIKVGGEASIINVSSPTPDGSVDGEVEVKGKLKAKDTVIQGDFKAFSDSDTNPQFRFYSKQGVNCQVDIQSAANTRASLKLANSQGSFELRRNSSTTSLQFTDGTNTPLTLDGNTATFAGDLTVDTNTLHVDSTNNTVGIGTTSPSSELHISTSSPYPSLLLESTGASANIMRFTTTDGTFTVGQDYDDNFSIANAANITSNRVFTILKSNGNVGIGTTSPSEALDVSGNVISTGTVTSSAGVCQGPQKYIFQASARAYTRNNYWFWPNGTYGINYYQWNSTASSSTLNSSYYDAWNPQFIVPVDMTINEYYYYGNTSGRDNTFELALRHGSGVAWDDTHNDHFSMATVGTIQSGAWTANSYNKIGQTGLSVSLSAGDSLIPHHRRTTNNDSTIEYMEIVFVVVC